jgi:hypothetical protein
MRRRGRPARGFDAGGFRLGQASRVPCGREHAVADIVVGNCEGGAETAVGAAGDEDGLLIMLLGC